MCSPGGSLGEYGNSMTGASLSLDLALRLQGPHYASDPRSACYITLGLYLRRPLRALLGLTSTLRRSTLGYMGFVPPLVDEGGGHRHLYGVGFRLGLTGGGV
jgi:hypothetical protein